jgi:hypothetical protein
MVHGVEGRLIPSAMKFFTFCSFIAAKGMAGTGMAGTGMAGTGGANGSSA